MPDFAEFHPLTALTVFCTYVAIDMLYAWYILCVSARRPWASACLGAGIYTLAAFGVLSYSKNPIYILPLACGSFLGTYLTVRLHTYFAGKK